MADMKRSTGIRVGRWHGARRRAVSLLAVLAVTVMGVLGVRPQVALGATTYYTVKYDLQYYADNEILIKNAFQTSAAENTTTPEPMLTMSVWKDGTEYLLAPAYWELVEESDGQISDVLQSPYDFSAPVTDHLILQPVWDSLDTYASGTVLTEADLSALWYGDGGTANARENRIINGEYQTVVFTLLLGDHRASRYPTEIRLVANGAKTNPPLQKPETDASAELSVPYVMVEPEWNQPHTARYGFHEWHYYNLNQDLGAFDFSKPVMSDYKLVAYTRPGETGDTNFTNGTWHALRFVSDGKLLAHELVIEDNDPRILNPSSVITHEHYGFGGWKQDGVNYDFTKSVTASFPRNITLRAAWKGESHIVRYHSGENIVKVEVVSYGDYITPPKTYQNGTLADYWTTDDSGRTDKTFDYENTPVEGDLDLYAQWTSDLSDDDAYHTVTFRSRTASGDETVVTTVEVRQVKHGSPVTQPELSYAGHRLNRGGNDDLSGWYLDGPNDEPVAWDFATPVTSDLTLTAEWVTEAGGTDDEASHFVVTFMVDNGVYALRDVAKAGDAAVSVSVPGAPSKTDNEFLGWYLAGSTSDPDIRPEALTAMVSGATTYHARFKAQPTYTITYRYVDEDGNISTPTSVTIDGQVTANPQRLATGTSTTLIRPTAISGVGPTAGAPDLVWFMDEECTVEYKFGSTVTDSITLYGTYLKVYENSDSDRPMYSVWFIADDADETIFTEVSDIAQGELPDKDAVPADPERHGYTFVGWRLHNRSGNDWKAPKAQGGDYAADVKGIYKDTYVYAAWSTEVTHTITFMYRDSTNDEWASKGTLDVADEDTITATKDGVPQKNDLNSNASGTLTWFADEACTARYDFNTKITADITLYAAFIPNGGESSVAFYSNNKLVTRDGFTNPKGYLWGASRASIDVPDITAITVEGYVFEGWHVGSPSGPAWESIDAVYGEVNLHAKWVAKPPTTTQYTVAFYGVDQNHPALVYVVDATDDSSAMLQAPAVQVIPYTDDSNSVAYRFDSWWLDDPDFVDGGHKAYTAAEPYASTGFSINSDSVRSDRTYYAKFSQTEGDEPGSAPTRGDYHMITFVVAEGGKETVYSTYVKDGELPTIPSISTVDGETRRIDVPANRAVTMFDGWYATSSLSGAPYAQLPAATENAIYYGAMSTRKHTVTYLDNGIEVARQRVSHGQATAQPSYTDAEGRIPTWTTKAARNEDGTYEAYDFAAAVESDLALYAYYADDHVDDPSTCRVTFVNYKANGDNYVIVAHPAGTTVADPGAPRYTGATGTFIGWYEVRGSGPEAVQVGYDFDKPVTRNLTLYPKYDADAGGAYTVRLVSNLPGQEDVELSVDKGLSVSESAREDDYDTTLSTWQEAANDNSFVGWNTRSDGLGYVWDAETPVTDSITVYAQWETSPTCTVTFEGYETSGGNRVVRDHPVGQPVANPGSPENESASGTFIGWYVKGTSLGYDFTLPVMGNLTLSPRYDDGTDGETSYTVTLVPQLAGPANETLGVIKGMTINTVPTASSRYEETLERWKVLASGQEFRGWNTAANGSGFGWTTDTPITSDITVYAQWVSGYSGPYVVTFKSVGADDEVTLGSVKAYQGDQVPFPAGVSLAGYVLRGWDESASYTDAGDPRYDANATETDAITGDTTLYAWWQKDSGEGTPDETFTYHSVIFMQLDKGSKAGKVFATNTVYENGFASEPDPVPTDDVYEFVQWELSTNRDEAYNFATPVRSDIVLYAASDRKSYTVTLHANNRVVGECVIQYGDTVADLPAELNEKVVDHWSLDELGKTTYDPGSEEGRITQDTDLYAQWKPAPNDDGITYLTVTFESPEGTVIERRQVRVGGTVDEPVVTLANGTTVPTSWIRKDNRTQWAFGENGSVVSEDVTLVAQWDAGSGYDPDKAHYTVIFMSDGAAYAVFDVEVTEGSTPSINAPGNLAKDGYNFKGWLREGTTTPLVSGGSSIAVTGNAVYHAQWVRQDPASTDEPPADSDEPVTHVVTFMERDADTNDWEVLATQTVEDGQKATRVDLAGTWYTSAALSAPYDFNTPVRANITLYAGATPDTSSLPGTVTVRFISQGVTLATYTVRTNTSRDAGGNFKDISGADVIAPDLTHTLEGFAFETWRVGDAAPDVNGAPWDNVRALYADTDVYATWVPKQPVKKQFVIRFYSLGNSEDRLVAAKVVDLNGSVVPPVVENVNASDRFLGWSTEWDDERGAGDSPLYQADDSVFANIRADANYYARFAENNLPNEEDYTVRFVVDGALYRSVTKRGTTSAFDAPAYETSAGKTFIGWYGTKDFDSAGTRYLAVGTSVPAEAATYYGTASADTYRVEFYDDSDTGYRVAEIAVRDGELLAEPAYVNAAGRTPISWSKVASQTGVDGAEANDFDFTKPMTSTSLSFSDKVARLYARYASTDDKAPGGAVTVRFFSNGQLVDTQTLPSGTTSVVAPQVEMGAGYVFVGWHSDQAMTSLIEDTAGTVEGLSGTPTLTISGDTDFYGKWRDSTKGTDVDGDALVTVTFLSTGDDGKEFVYHATQAAIGSAVADPGHNARADWGFRFWRDGKETAGYDFATKLATNKVLKAKWSPKVYFYAGTKLIGTQTVDLGHKVTDLPAELAGKLVDHWSFDIDGKRGFDPVLNLVMGPMTLYAQFKPADDLDDGGAYLTVIFKANDTVVETRSVKAGDTLAQPDVSWTDSAGTTHVPATWEREDNGVTWNFDTSANPDVVVEDMTLVAEWDDGSSEGSGTVHYTITYVVDGSIYRVCEVTPSPNTSGSPASVTTPLTLYKDGYALASWDRADDALVSVMPGAETSVTGDATFTGVWNTAKDDDPSQPSGTKSTHVVTFKTSADGGSTWAVQETREVEHGSVVAAAAIDPSQQNGASGAWYTSKALDAPFDFTLPVLADVTVYLGYVDNTTNDRTQGTATVHFISLGSELASYTVNKGTERTAGIIRDTEDRAVVSPDITNTLEGYALDAWRVGTKDAADHDGAPWESVGAVYGDLYVYASWVPKTALKNLVAVQFYSLGNDDDHLVVTRVTEVGGSVVPPLVKAREGYEFRGWTTEWSEAAGATAKSGTSEPYASNHAVFSNVTQDATYYARFTSTAGKTPEEDNLPKAGQDHTVTFLVDGGLYASVTTNDAFAAPEAPSSTGNSSFFGWYADKGFSTSDSPSVAPAGTVAKPTADVTYYGTFAGESYKVQFIDTAIADDTTKVVAEATATVGELLVEPAYVNAKNHTPISWTIDEAKAHAYDFTLPVTKDRLRYTNVNGEHVAKLYAKFAAGDETPSSDVYRVRFFSNGDLVGSVTGTGGTSFVAPQVKRDGGYTFAGWFTNESYTGSPLADSASSTPGQSNDDTRVTIGSVNVDYYARWTTSGTGGETLDVPNDPNQVTVTFVSTRDNGGVEEEFLYRALQVAEGGSVAHPGHNERSRHDFDGWYEAGETLPFFSSEDEGTPSIKLDTDKLLKAQWDLSVFTVKFVTLVGVTNSSTDEERQAAGVLELASQDVNGGDQASDPHVTYGGKVPQGWRYSKASLADTYKVALPLTINADTPGMSDGTLTLYATWDNSDGPQEKIDDYIVVTFLNGPTVVETRIVPTTNDQGALLPSLSVVPPQLYHRVNDTEVAADWLEGETRVSQANATITINPEGGAYSNKTYTAHWDGYTADGTEKYVSYFNPYTSSTLKIDVVTLDDSGSGTTHAPLAPASSTEGETFKGWYYTTDNPVSDTARIGEDGGSLAVSGTDPLTLVLAYSSGSTVNVTYDANGGWYDDNTTKTTVTKQVLYNAAVDGVAAYKPDSNPTRTDYDMLPDWYTSADGDSFFDLQERLTSDTTVYAHWTPRTYTVQYYAGGVKVAEETGVAAGGHPTSPATYNIVDTKLNRPTGWTVGSSGAETLDDAQVASLVLSEGTEAYGIGNELKADSRAGVLKLYAVWGTGTGPDAGDTNVTLTFYNDKRLVETQVVKAGSVVTPPPLEWEGHTLKWFFKINDLRQQQTLTPEGTFTAPSADRRYDAIWFDGEHEVPLPYDDGDKVYVTYLDADDTNDDGIGRIKIDIITKNDTTAKGTTTAPTEDEIGIAVGKTLNGWSDGTALRLTPAQNTMNNLADDLTLSADWKKPVYSTVTFNAGDGAFKSDEPDVDDTLKLVTKDEIPYNGPIGNAKPRDPEREGYSFTGWFTDPSDSSTEFTTDDFANTRITSTLALVAGWAPESLTIRVGRVRRDGSSSTLGTAFTVSYSKNSGQNVDLLTASNVGSAQDVNAQDGDHFVFTTSNLANGYQVVGWHVVQVDELSPASGDVELTYTGTTLDYTMGTKSVTIDAVVEPITYTITQSAVNTNYYYEGDLTDSNETTHALSINSNVTPAIYSYAYTVEDGTIALPATEAAMGKYLSLKQFVGWNASIAGGKFKAGSDYVSGPIENIEEIEATTYGYITLMPQWADVDPEVVQLDLYKSATSDNAPTQLVVRYSDEVSVNVPNGEEGSTSVTLIDSEGNVSAMTTPTRSYTISYDLDGGTVNGQSSIPDRTLSYTFNGYWSKLATREQTAEEAGNGTYPGPHMVCYVDDENPANSGVQYIGADGKPTEHLTLRTVLGGNIDSTGLYLAWLSLAQSNRDQVANLVIPGEVAKENYHFDGWRVTAGPASLVGETFDAGAILPEPAYDETGNTEIRLKALLSDEYGISYTVEAPESGVNVTSVPADDQKTYHAEVGKSLVDDNGGYLAAVSADTDSDGWYFAGWRLPDNASPEMENAVETDSDGYVTAIKQGAQVDIELVAVFSQKLVEIRLVPGANTSNTQPLSVYVYYHDGERKLYEADGTTEVDRDSLLPSRSYEVSYQYNNGPVQTNTGTALTDRTLTVPFSGYQLNGTSYIDVDGGHARLADALFDLTTTTQLTGAWDQTVTIDLPDEAGLQKPSENLNLNDWLKKAGSADPVPVAAGTYTPADSESVLVFTPNWVDGKNVISYDTKGGVWPDGVNGNRRNFGDHEATPSTTITEPQRNGYTFTGWRVSVSSEPYPIVEPNTPAAVNLRSLTSDANAFGFANDGDDWNQSAELDESNTSVAYAYTYTKASAPNPTTATLRLPTGLDGATRYTILLEAQWSDPVTYQLTLNLNDTDIRAAHENNDNYVATMPLGSGFAGNGGNPTTYSSSFTVEDAEVTTEDADQATADANESKAIPNPKNTTVTSVPVGYNFAGWLIEGYDHVDTAPDGRTVTVTTTGNVVYRITNPSETSSDYVPYVDAGASTLRVKPEAALSLLKGSYGNATVKAAWTADAYQLRLWLNGATEPAASDEGVYTEGGETYTLSPTYTYDTDYATSPTAAAESQIARTTTVHYRGNGDARYDNMVYSYDHTLTGWNTLKTPTTETPGTAVATGAAADSFNSGLGNSLHEQGDSLYAQWQINPIARRQNGTGALEVEVGRDGGYKFVGWVKGEGAEEGERLAAANALINGTGSDDENGLMYQYNQLLASGTDPKADAEFMSNFVQEGDVFSEADIYLYAMWARSYNITYVDGTGAALTGVTWPTLGDGSANTGDHSVNPNPSVFLYDDTVDPDSVALLANPVRTGFRFVGWTLNSKDTTPTTSMRLPVTAARNHTLYAHFTASDDTINLVANLPDKDGIVIFKIDGTSNSDDHITYYQTVKVTTRMSDGESTYYQGTATVQLPASDSTHGGYTVSVVDAAPWFDVSSSALTGSQGDTAAGGNGSVIAYVTQKEAQADRPTITLDARSSGADTSTRKKRGTWVVNAGVTV